MQDHSLNTVLSVCKPATCCGLHIAITRLNKELRMRTTMQCNKIVFFYSFYCILLVYIAETCSWFAHR